MLKRKRIINDDFIVHQGKLEDALNSIFPNENVKKNVRKEASIKNPHTGGYLEVDVWYPDLKICFEYQDDYHYQPTWYSHIPLAVVQGKDNAKRDMLLQRGETLILVPCWWDGTAHSLQSTIQFHRPDLAQLESLNVIPLNPPSNFFEAQVLENFKLMLASFPKSVDMVDITENANWWLGEKYDGVRCYWNPQHKLMYSRQGITINMLPPMYTSFGNIVLDGEIWCGRGLFLESHTLLQGPFERADWSLSRVICFDEASKQMMAQPFERRYSRILMHFHPEHPTLIIASRFLCKTAQVLARSLQQVVDEGGEGIILRKPQSIYYPGRTTSLIKLKGSRGDQEALVVDVEDDGSLLLQLPDGTRFIVVKDDCVLHRRAVRGDVVTFTHDFRARRAAQGDAHDPATARTDTDARENAATQEALRGVPSNPIVFRIREDLSWEDVVRNSSLPVRHFLNQDYQKIYNFTPKKKGYWLYDKGKNMRSFLESLAKLRGLDPLVPDTWYNVPRQEFSEHREVRTIIHHYGSLSKALVDLFPELDLKLTKFTGQYNLWNTMQNQREWFERFAHLQGGNPFDSQFWYSVNPKEFFKFKGIAMDSQNKDFVEAVMHMFPDLNLEKTKFAVQSTRSFLDNFALTHGFDPLISDNWYSVPFIQFIQHPGFSKALQGYNKLSVCLLQLYPDIGLQKSKLIQYDELFHRRKLFHKFAYAKGGYPSDPNFWYSLNPTELLKATKVVLYTKSYAELVTRLFPELYLDRNKFKHPENKKKQNTQAIRELFERFARKNGNDPLDPQFWYSINPKELRKVKGMRKAVKYYKGYIKTVTHLFPELHLERSKFVFKVQLWRTLFNNFAKSNGFDPLVPENWYKTSCDALVQNEDVSKVLRYYQNNLHQALVDIYPELTLDKSKFVPISYDTENQRKLFEIFAQENSKNPQFWYSLSSADLPKEILEIVRYYKGFPHCVMSLFPELNLIRSNFSKNGEQPSWGKQKERRKFFDLFAMDQGFDPLVPDNWYNVSQVSLAQRTGYETVLKYHGGKLADCLMQLYPDIGLQPAKFGMSPRKAVLVHFAKLRGFDPFVADNWYSVASGDLNSFPKARAIVQHYKGYVAALMDLFPNIGLNPAKFKKAPQGYWEDEKNRRLMFCDIAHQQNFDPLLPNNWYSVTYSSLRNIKGANSILEHYYSGSLVKGLLQLFPDIGLEESKFHNFKGKRAKEKSLPCLVH
eukprot:Phypoly_transcript_01045.p1 GENE.Phypoly_transcript_01045~~Phypoly_transcript_01045.p1  ORF type:complete len:1215 (-),score=190.78 Phypoly_transcript_01045:36-3680(-)